MEEIEVPTEHLHEEMHHQAEHAGAAARWISQVALSSAILAALAAVSAMLSGHHANEAMLEQIHASDHWAYYQAKSIKASVLNAKIDLLEAQDKKISPKDEEKARDYTKDQDEISAEAKGEEGASAAHLVRHQTLARAVTLFQIAIAIGAISVLTRRRQYWWVSLVAGGVGTVFLLLGVL